VAAEGQDSAAELAAGTVPSEPPISRGKKDNQGHGHSVVFSLLSDKESLEVFLHPYNVVLSHSYTCCIVALIFP
jgi:hypothetical protein